MTRPDGRPQTEARDFDLIVVGGGTFGAVVAEHLSFRDKARIIGPQAYANPRYFIRYRHVRLTAVALA